MTDQRKQKIKKFVDKLYLKYKTYGISQFINLIDSMLFDIEKKPKKSKVDDLRVEFLNDVKSILIVKGVVVML